MFSVSRTARLTWLLGVALTLGGRCFPATCAAGEWVDGRLVGPFLCRADFPLGGLESLFAELRRLHGDVVRQLNLAGCHEPIELYLFHDRETYAAYLRRYFPALPYRRALFVKSKGPGMVFAYWSHQFDVDLRHECTHALLHAMVPEIPLWLDEGLATYFESPVSQRGAGDALLVSAGQQLRAGTMATPEALERITDLSGMGRQQYRDAWAWVHYMLHGDPEAREELLGYLADLAAQKPTAPLSARLRCRLTDPSQRLAAYLSPGRQ